MHAGSIPAVASTCVAGRSRFAKQAGFVIAPLSFPGSSVVEQPAVNRLVAGSNPARGANIFNDLDEAVAKVLTSKTTFGNAIGNKTQVSQSPRICSRHVYHVYNEWH